MLVNRHPSAKAGFVIGSVAPGLVVPHQDEKVWLGPALKTWAFPGESGQAPSSCLHAPHRHDTWTPIGAVVPAASPMELREHCGEQWGRICMCHSPRV